MLAFLDILFIIFHTALIFFNALGWSFKSTRKWNLITLLLTGASWFILGIWYGWGYCICTDLHYDILRQLGEKDLPWSYLTYLLQRTTGWNPPTEVVNISLLTGFILALILSIYSNLRDRTQRKRP